MLIFCSCWGFLMQILVISRVKSHCMWKACGIYTRWSWTLPMFRSDWKFALIVLPPYEKRNREEKVHEAYIHEPNLVVISEKTKWMRVCFAGEKDITSSSIARQCNVIRGMNGCFECFFLFPSGRDQTSFIRMWFVKFPVSASILSIFIDKKDKFLFHFSVLYCGYSLGG